MKKGILITSLIIAALALVAVVVFLIVPAFTPTNNIGITTNPGTTTNPSTTTNPGITNPGTTSGGTNSGGTSSGGSTPSAPPTTPPAVPVGSAGPAAVNLGTAGNFVILSQTGISTTGTTSIVGDMGVSPAAATYITGFGLILGAGNYSSTSSLVTGNVYAADYLGATPAKMTTAVSDMQTAYTDAAGRTNPTATEVGAVDISGMTIYPGLYKWGTGV